MKDRENESEGRSGEFGRRWERVPEEADHRRSPEVSVDGELDARNRAEALARARELRLLQ